MTEIYCSQLRGKDMNGESETGTCSHGVWTTPRKVLRHKGRRWLTPINGRDHTPGFWLVLGFCVGVSWPMCQEYPWTGFRHYVWFHNYSEAGPDIRAWHLRVLWFYFGRCASAP